MLLINIQYYGKPIVSNAGHSLQQVTKEVVPTKSSLCTACQVQTVRGHLLLLTCIKVPRGPAMALVTSVA